MTRTATIIKRRDGGTFWSPMGHRAEASAVVGCDDHGRRVVHGRVGSEHTETPICGTRREGAHHG